MSGRDDFGLITRADAESRFLDGPYNFYMQSTFLVKGAVFTVAADVALDSFDGAIDAVAIERLVLFTATCCIVLIPIATYLRGVILASGEMHLVDYFAPFAMGFAEVMMFRALSPGSDIESYQSAWLFAVGLQATFAVMLIVTRVLSTSLSGYAPDIHQIVDRYKRWMIGDCFGAAVFALSAIGLSAWGGQLELPTWSLDLSLCQRQLGSWIASVPSVSAYSLVAAGYGVVALVVSWKALWEQRKIGAWLRAAAHGTAPIT